MSARPSRSPSPSSIRHDRTGHGRPGARRAIALLIQPRPVVWAVAAVVAASAAGAVLLSTYVDLGALGPLPDMYEPTWALPGKAGSAIAETAATVLALAGLTLTLRNHRRAVT